jgi:ankyrin repeat protein
MNLVSKILIAFELNDIEEVSYCLQKGVDINALHEGKPLIYSLINMYSRGPARKACIQKCIDYGLEFPDTVLLAALTDNAAILEKELIADPTILTKKYDLDCTFTPLYQATLLHICAEYNHVNCAKLLLSKGADIDAKAGLDENGFGGHTAIFHTVNQHQNFNIEMLHLLLSYKPNLDLTVQGLIWGKGYEWETYIPSVNPISYAIMGLLRQFQRTEADIYHIVSLLTEAKTGQYYMPKNVPNRYLS